MTTPLLLYLWLRKIGSLWELKLWNSFRLFGVISTIQWTKSYSLEVSSWETIRRSCPEVLFRIDAQKIENSRKFFAKYLLLSPFFKLKLLAENLELYLKLIPLRMLSWEFSQKCQDSYSDSINITSAGGCLQICIFIKVFSLTLSKYFLNK